MGEVLRGGNRSGAICDARAWDSAHGAAECDVANGKGAAWRLPRSVPLACTEDCGVVRVDGEVVFPLGGATRPMDECPITTTRITVLLRRGRLRAALDPIGILNRIDETEPVPVGADPEIKAAALKLRLGGASKDRLTARGPLFPLSQIIGPSGLLSAEFYFGGHSHIFPACRG
jgi:hypothetical protein